MGMQRAKKNKDLIEEEKNKGYILLNINTFCQMWYWYKKRQTNGTERPRHRHIHYYEI